MMTKKKLALVTMAGLVMAGCTHTTEVILKDTGERVRTESAQGQFPDVSCPAGYYEDYSTEAGLGSPLRTVYCAKESDEQQSEDSNEAPKTAQKPACPAGQFYATADQLNLAAANYMWKGDFEGYRMSSEVREQLTSPAGSPDLLGVERISTPVSDSSVDYSREVLGRFNKKPLTEGKCLTSQPQPTRDKAAGTPPLANASNVPPSATTPTTATSSAPVTSTSTASTAQAGTTGSVSASNGAAAAGGGLTVGQGALIGTQAAIAGAAIYKMLEKDDKDSPVSN